MNQILPQDNVQRHPTKPIMLVHEVSSTEYYVGTSRRFSKEDDPHWRIQRILQSSGVWRFEYPDGKQSFTFEWSSRFGYTYAQ